MKAPPKPRTRSKRSAAAPRVADPATAYAQAVVSGEVVAGKYVKLACRRHLDDLAKSESDPAYPYHFDAGAAQVVYEFFGLLTHSKGRWGGEPFTLDPWQQFFAGSVFGWKRRADGLRRFRVAHLEVARKNGKTTLASGIGLYLLDLDGEPGAEVYTVATKRDQAKLAHGESTRMVKASPVLRNRIRVFRDNLSVEDTHSKYEPLTAEGDSLDGLNVHGAICDELHAWKQRLLWDVIETASGAREQPLRVIVTTAGYDRQSIWWERRQLAIRVLEGVYQDDSLFALIYTLDENDDWVDEAVWPKANPSLGVTVKLEDLRKECEEAKQTPGKQNAFKRLKLNLPTDQADCWLDMDLWRENGNAPVDPAALKGRDCYAGLDLSSTTDLTALALIFPEEAGGYTVLTYYWHPKEGAARREQKDRVPYSQWDREGFIELTPGGGVDYAFIKHKMDELRGVYNVVKVGFDPYNALQLGQQLLADGWDVEEVRQGPMSLSPACKELERAVVCRQFRHGNNPITNWCAANVVITTDSNGNLKPDKSTSTGRIDGIAAIVTGLARYLPLKREGPSVYESQGLDVL